MDLSSRRSRGAAVASAGVLAVVLAGCGSAAGDRAGAPQGDKAEEVSALPLERYQLSDAEGARHMRANAVLAQRCMVDFGFADFPREPKQPGDGSGSATLVAVAPSTPFGEVDLGQVRRWGYGWDPKKATPWPPREGREMTKEEYAVLYGSGSAGPEGPGGGAGAGKVRGRAVPEGGCSGVAARQLERGVKDAQRMATQVFQAEERARKATAKDPKVRKAWDTWSRCVQEKGFKRYAKPDDAFGDKAWRRSGSTGNTTRTEKEIGTAVADVECKREHGTVAVWWSALAERQQREIDRDKAAYAAVLRDVETVRANIRRALDGK